MTNPHKLVSATLDVIDDLLSEVKSERQNKDAKHSIFLTLVLAERMVDMERIFRIHSGPENEFVSEVAKLEVRFNEARKKIWELGDTLDQKELKYSLNALGNGLRTRFLDTNKL